jgi:hypothetical protein
MLHFYRQTKEASARDNLREDAYASGPSPQGSESPMLSISKVPNDSKETDAGGGLGEINYNELKHCLRAIAAHLKTDLDLLVGKVLTAHFANESLMNEGAHYEVDMSEMNADQQHRFMEQSAHISKLLCELGAYEGAIDTCELLLRCCYKVDNIQDIGNEDSFIVEGAMFMDLIIEVLATYSRASYLQILGLTKKRKLIQQQLDSQEDNLNNANIKENQRRRTAASLPQTTAHRREEEEHQAAFTRQIQKLKREIDQTRGIIADNTNQLRWTRRNAAVAGLAAKHLLADRHKAAHKSDSWMTESGVITQTKTPASVPPAVKASTSHALVESDTNSMAAQPLASATALADALEEEQVGFHSVQVHDHSIASYPPPLLS